jgi:hypothetical protein
MFFLLSFLFSPDPDFLLYINEIGTLRACSFEKRKAKKKNPEKQEGFQLLMHLGGLDPLESQECLCV